MLNREDPEWFWIVRSDGQEGFIPSGFVYPADNVLHNNTKPAPLNGNETTPAPQDPQQQSTINSNNNTSNLPAVTNLSHPIANNILNNNTTTNNINNNANNTTNSNNNNNSVQSQQQQQQQQPVLGGSDDLRYHGTELVMLYDYKVIISQQLLCSFSFSQMKLSFIILNRRKHRMIYLYDVVTGYMLI